MKQAYIHSKIFLKSGNIAEFTSMINETEVDDLEKELKETCEMMAKLYNGEHELYNINWTKFEIIQGMMLVRTENVEMAIVTYQIVET